MKVHESGYTYKKKESRSKVFGSSSSSAEPQPKRIKTTSMERQQRLKDLRQELKDLNGRVSYKRKRVIDAENSKNYKLCDALTEEIGELNKEIRGLECEKKIIEKKEKSSMYYRKRVSSDSDSSCSVRSKQSSRSVTPHSLSESASLGTYPAVRTENVRITSPPPISVAPGTTVRVASSPDNVRTSVTEVEHEGMTLQDTTAEHQLSENTTPVCSASTVPDTRVSSPDLEQHFH